MKKMFGIAALVLGICVALLGAGNAFAQPASQDEPAKAADQAVERSSLDIIREMALYYGAYGDDAVLQVEEHMEELRSIDPAAALKWEEILQLWGAAEQGVDLNYDVLPDGLPDTDELCIIVLGFQLNRDGTMKEELIQRLNVALASARKYPNALIACTGGGTAAGDRTVTEAGRMADWLIEHGIDSDRVIVEDQSITTAQNAIYTCRILQEEHPQVSSLAIVSSDYHIATGELLFATEVILTQDASDTKDLAVISNAAWKAPKGTLPRMFRAGALIELAGDAETAFAIYHETYDISDLPEPEDGGQ